MAEIFMKTVGLKELQDKLRSLGPRGRTAIAKRLVKKAYDIIADSQRNYVPVMFGVLKDSAIVSAPEESASMIRVGMGFGGAAKAYALAVHEHLSAYSPPSWKAAERGGRGVHFTVGGPKYLETPFLKATGGGRLEKDIAAAITEEWERT